MDFSPYKKTEIYGHYPGNFWLPDLPFNYSPSQLNRGHSIVWKQGDHDGIWASKAANDQNEVY